MAPPSYNKVFIWLSAVNVDLKYQLEVKFGWIIIKNSTMDHFTALDPYEQQLLKVFDSHDRDNCGSLDRDGLMQLCQTLQLEEQGHELIRCLLKDKSSRATFHEFKDALLALLGKMQQNKENNINDITSPEREVSPRFTYGSKKYGRRSRPRQDAVVDSNDEITSPVSVQRSNSQVEVSSKKRKTNYKLKRCTSLPGNNSSITYDNSFIHNQGFDTEIVCTEEMLREAWKKLGVGEGGYLNQEELVLIFEEIGLNKLANSVLRQLNKLSFDKISFQELLEILQQDETWFDLLNSQQNASSNENFADSRTFQYVTLGPDGNGFVNAEGLIEMWEQVGMHSPKELLHELGFNCRKINICELADILEKQLKGINETTRNEYQSPHVALLQANLALYQGEIRCFKNVLEQLHAEREKLKGDVLEANKRATLLAQEVDDNHLRMEQNTINQVKLLEQRHADILKEVTEQFTKDKEQLTSLNFEFEKRITDLEAEIIKLRNDLLISQKYSLNIEKENTNLSSQIQDLEKDKNLLTKQIEVLENERQQLQERELEETQLLRDKMKELQIENTNLKDRSDEMVSEIESLSGQIQSMRNKVSSTPTHHSLDQSMEENISFICEGGVGVGAKRRNDCSPTKDSVYRFNGSPRLGKVRKFTNKTNTDHNLETNLPLTSSESGFDTEIDCCDSSLSASINNDEEIIKLRARNAFLEQILLQNSIPIPDYDQDNYCDKSNLSARVKQLECLILSIKEQYGQSEQLDDIIRNVRDKLKVSDTKCVSVQTDFNDALSPSMLDEVKKLESTNSELSAKCAELENCIDLLRNEYEQCEDYWQNKVDEERQLFELEQKQNTDKLNDLIEKMKEYEEQFAITSQQDNKLPTIEEFNLEKQFTDLEQEYEEYKMIREEELREKDEEIQQLKQQLEIITSTSNDKQSKDVSTQISEDMYEKMKHFSSYIVEHTSRSADDMQSPAITENAINWDLRINNNPSSSSSTLEKNPTTPCRPKRTRKREMIYKKNNIDTKKTETASSAASTIGSIAGSDHNSAQFHKIDDPASTIRNMHRKIMYLEQRLRHMQFLMRKQYFETDQTLQYYWQQLNAEKGDLQCKLRFLQEKYEHQRRICHEQAEKLEQIGRAHV